MINRKLITVLLLLLATFGLDAVGWYRTSPSGIPGAPINGEGPSDNGWSLSIEHGENRETRALYLDGELQGRTVFRREGGRLVAREELDSTGKVISRVEYAYDAEGNPRAVFIGMDSDNSGFNRISSDIGVNADTTVRRISGGHGGSWRITDMDESGNPTSALSLDSDGVQEEVSWKRNDDGQLKEEIRRSGDDVVRSLYDPEGRLVEETVMRGAATVMVRNYMWSDGNLVRMEERGEGRFIVREMEWSGDRISREVRSIDGVKASEVSWSGPEDKVETLYRDGEAIIRVYWSDGVKRKEEFLKSGEVIRVRGDEG